MAPRSHKLFFALLVVCAVISAHAAAAAESADFDSTLSASTRLKVRGKEAKFKLIGANDSYIEVSFEGAREVDSIGTPIFGRSIASLSAAKPAFAQGNATIDGAVIPYVELKMNLTSLLAGAAIGAKVAACPGGAVSAFAAVGTTAAPQGSIAIKAFYDIKNDTVFPYGAGNNVTISAGSLKVNLEAANWPFCSMSNSLAVDLVVKTSRNDSTPVVYNDDGSYEDVRANVTVAASVEANATSASASGSASINGNASSSQSRRFLKAIKVGVDVSAGLDDVQVLAAGIAANASAGAGATVQAAVAAGAGDDSGRGRRRQRGGDRPRNERSREAVFLVGGDLAASLNMQEYAYDAVNGSVRSNVTVLVASSTERGDDDNGSDDSGSSRRGRGSDDGSDDDDSSTTSTSSSGDGDGVSSTTRLRLVFPAFEGTLYYDPSVAMTSASEAGYSAAEADGRAALLASSSNSGSTTTTSGSASTTAAAGAPQASPAPAPKNSATVARAVTAALASAPAAALLLLAL